MKVKASHGYEVQGNIVLDPAGKKIFQVPDEIWKFAVYKDFALVLTGAGQVTDRNIYCFELDGNLRWQIERPLDMDGKPLRGFRRYIGFDVNPETRLIHTAADSPELTMLRCYSVDPKTGKMTFEELSK